MKSRLIGKGKDMAGYKQVVIFDTNVWISFTIGKKLTYLGQLLGHPELDIYTCEDTVREYIEVINRPKFKKYITASRIEETLALMSQFSTIYRTSKVVAESRDPKDNYLLATAIDLGADYLITGDQDLLVHHPFGKTQILTFNDFVLRADSGFATEGF